MKLPKQRINLDESGNSYLTFSNPMPGFIVSAVDSKNDSHLPIFLRPDGNLAKFVCAVVDYSHANGLRGVPRKELLEMMRCLSEAFKEVGAELADRSPK